MSRDYTVGLWVVVDMTRGHDNAECTIVQIPVWHKSRLCRDGVTQLVVIFYVSVARGKIFTRGA